MNMMNFIKYINERNKWNIQPAYYAKIDQWKQWWRGYYEPFHLIQERLADGRLKKRKLYRLNMPKKICADWATLLLNDKTTVSLNDDATSKWLQGENGIGGQLGALDFWRNANHLVEKAFRSGTGAFVMSVEGMGMTGETIDVTPDARICLDYDPAECILPLTVRHGKVVDVAFASEVFVEGKVCVYLQTHKLESDGYVITNEYFVSQQETAETASFRQVENPTGVLETVRTCSHTPWFAILTPNAEKTDEAGPGLGEAVFADAIDQIKGVDIAYNNLVMDIRLGGKKVFYDKSLSREVSNAEGKPVTVTPDDLMQQLFLEMGDGMGLDQSSDPIHEYNPSLRVEENVKAVQTALDLLSFRCGLGMRYYNFSAEGQAVTAKQYTGDRQDMVQHANRHQIIVESALKQIIRSILWAGKTILGAQIDPDTEITVDFDDSYISDTDAQREQMRQDCISSAIPWWMYTAKYYPVTETEAKELVEEARGAETVDLFGGA